MKRRRKKSKPGPPAWTKGTIHELRGKAAFLGCAVDPIPTPFRTKKWVLVVPGQSLMKVHMSSTSQRYRTERTALIRGIQWVLNQQPYRKD